MVSGLGLRYGRELRVLDPKPLLDHEDSLHGDPGLGVSSLASIHGNESSDFRYGVTAAAWCRGYETWRAIRRPDIL